jgi:hypothetical protein
MRSLDTTTSQGQSHSIPLTEVDVDCPQECAMTFSDVKLQRCSTRPYFSDYYFRSIAAAIV